jgi:chemosensory pili system protein ChpA (sensor histidine kinase/response regulator)
MNSNSPQERPLVKRSPRLLCVDDDESSRILVGLMFEHSGFNIFYARDGLEAIKKLAEMGTADVILLDWMMPRMDGMEMLKVLKADPRYCGIPVVMHTAASGADEARKVMQAGAYYCLFKPYDEETARNIVLAALRENRIEVAAP